jgi:hypothetical protein
MKIALFSVFLSVCVAMNAQQTTIARRVMQVLNTPKWSVIIDAVQVDTVAFTDADLKRVYIDTKRFVKTPKTFTNVVIHECNHLLGAKDYDESKEMIYAVRFGFDGNVLEDDFLLIPQLQETEVR